MVQTAKVTRLLADGRAEVAVRRQSACGHDCDKCGGGCAELTVRATVAVVAENRLRAQIGDTVTVESGTGGILGAAALVYLLPFALFFSGYFLGAGIGLGAGGGAALGVFGFAVGVALAVLGDRRERRRGSISFKITAIEQGA